MLLTFQHKTAGSAKFSACQRSRATFLRHLHVEYRRFRRFSHKADQYDPFPTDFDVSFENWRLHSDVGDPSPCARAEITMCGIFLLCQTLLRLTKAASGSRQAPSGSRRSPRPPAQNRGLNTPQFRPSSFQLPPFSHHSHVTCLEAPARTIPLVFVLASLLANWSFRHFLQTFGVLPPHRKHDLSWKFKLFDSFNNLACLNVDTTCCSTSC